MPRPRSSPFVAGRAETQGPLAAPGSPSRRLQAERRQVDAHLRKVGNFERQQLAIPSGLLGEAVVGQHVGAPLALAEVGKLGFTNPVLVDGENGIIAGHGRVLAARKLGLTSVPVIADPRFRGVEDLLPRAGRAALRIADPRWCCRPLLAQRGFADLEKRAQGQILGPMPD